MVPFSGGKFQFCSAVTPPQLLLGIRLWEGAGIRLVVAGVDLGWSGGCFLAVGQVTLPVSLLVKSTK